MSLTLATLVAGSGAIVATLTFLAGLLAEAS